MQVAGCERIEFDAGGCALCAEALFWDGLIPDPQAAATTAQRADRRKQEQLEAEPRIDC